MIDLSITKDPEWIKQREELWKPISKMLSEDLRKNELEKVHNYFMTGVLRPGEKMSDGAKVGWFPIQTPDAWDYLFQSVVKDKKEYEFWFYFSFEDLSHRALNAEQELALWDYFIGNEFKPIVTSKVPVGDKKEIVSFDVDKRNVASKFGLFFKNWAGGGNNIDNPKHVRRIDYYFSILQSVVGDIFVEKDSSGDLVSDLAYTIALGFERICRPEYGVQSPLSKEATAIRKVFFAGLRGRLDELPMPPEMKAVWEKTKSDGIVE